MGLVTIRYNSVSIQRIVLRERLFYTLGKQIHEWLNTTMMTVSDTAPVTHPLRRLFQPGNGVAPPYLAGRETEMDALCRLLASLTVDKRPSPKDAVVFGPRGNGKTVLLDAFADSCRGAGADVIETTPDEIGDEGVLEDWLLGAPSHPQTAAVDRAARTARRIGRSLPKRGGIQIGGGMVSSQWDRSRPAGERRRASLQLVPDLLATCQASPRVALVDEAHTLDVAVGRRLLNTSQRARTRGAPFLLVMAGTPNVRNHLDAMSSTFWSRCTRVGTGRLSEQAVREALVKPLSDYGVTFTEEALIQVVDESQCYPYFIQCWGKVLCDEWVRRGLTRDDVMDPDVVAAARPRFAAVRTDYYEDRYRELTERHLLPIAAASARVFGDALNLNRRRLEEDVVRLTGQCEEATSVALEQLSDLGYLWQTALEPGIPSLMKHVLYHDEGTPDSPFKDVPA